MKTPSSPYCQFSVESVFPQIFRYERKYREDGTIFYHPLEPSTDTPTGIRAFDDFLSHLSRGATYAYVIAHRMDVATADLSGLVRLLTGMTASEFINAYLMHKVALLLRYTDLSGREVAQICHLKTVHNLEARLQYSCGQTITACRYSKRQQGDCGRFLVDIKK